MRETNLQKQIGDSEVADYQRCEFSTEYMKPVNVDKIISLTSREMTARV